MFYAMFIMYKISSHLDGITFYLLSAIVRFMVKKTEKKRIKTKVSPFKLADVLLLISLRAAIYGKNLGKKS